MGAPSSAPRSGKFKLLRVLFAVALVLAINKWGIRGGKSSEEPSASPPASRELSEKFSLLPGCTLSSHPSNDGDSFAVHIPGSSATATLRLYFVDSPESSFRQYRSGETNHDRIREQASYFHITPEQAVSIGQAAKKRSLELLAAGPFTVATRWDDPFHDQRYHAFVTLSNGRELIETLVREGLVRIHTKGSDRPDGTSMDAYRRQLRILESEARQNRRGAWALAPSPS